MRRMADAVGVLLVVLTAPLGGCGNKPEDPGNGGPGPGLTAEHQTPPTTGRTDMEAWLARGFYKSWTCQPSAHPPSPSSAHDSARVCANQLAAGHRTGEYPVGAANVKEMFDAGGALIGYAVQVHVTPGPGGDNWYWYERVGPNLIADAVGAPGCAGCHQLAGSDASHPGHDFVFNQLP